MQLIHWKLFFTTIVITIFFISLFVALRLYIPLDCDFKRRKRSECLSNCKTGDIVTVAYGSTRAKIIKVFTASMWAHSGVIIKIDNKPYVLEAARYSRTENGVMVTPLEQWLTHNEPYIVGWRPYVGEGLNTTKINEFMASHKGTGVDMFVVSWLKSMFRRRYVKKDHIKRKYFCSELVSHFLQEIGVMREKYKPSSYKPWELLYGDLPLKRGHEYGKPSVVEAD